MYNVRRQPRTYLSYLSRYENVHICWRDCIIYVAAGKKNSDRISDKDAVYKDFDEEVDYFLVYCYSDWNQYNGKEKKMKRVNARF